MLLCAVRPAIQVERGTARSFSSTFKESIWVLLVAVGRHERLLQSSYILSLSAAGGLVKIARPEVFIRAPGNGLAACRRLGALLPLPRQRTVFRPLMWLGAKSTGMGCIPIPGRCLICFAVV